MEKLQRRLSDLQSNDRLKRHASAMEHEGPATWKLCAYEGDQSFEAKKIEVKVGNTLI